MEAELLPERNSLYTPHFNACVFIIFLSVIVVLIIMQIGLLLWIIFKSEPTKKVEVKKIKKKQEPKENVDDILDDIGEKITSTQEEIKQTKREKMDDYVYEASSKDIEDTE